MDKNHTKIQTRDYNTKLGADRDEPKLECTDGNIGPNEGFYSSSLVALIYVVSNTKLQTHWGGKIHNFCAENVNYRGQSGKFGHIYQNSDKQVGTVRADQSGIIKTININN